MTTMRGRLEVVEGGMDQLTSTGRTTTPPRGVRTLGAYSHSYYTPFLIMPQLGVFLLLLLALSCQVTGVKSVCPRDIETQAHSCFTDYSREYQNMQSSPTRLCCGVDVETLRAFCSSYMHAMTCITGLKKRCPGSTDIQGAMTNLHGAENALKALCSDDRIIEVYARYQTCFTHAGPSTELCFQRHLNTTDSVRLLHNVDAKHISEFCTDMRGTLMCIQKNVRNVCGEEASELAPVLVKPMVRQSTKCDYSVVTQAPVSRQDQPSPSSHDGSRHAGDPSSGASSVSAVLSFVWACTVIRTLFSFS